MLGEEGGGDDAARRTWVLDPIDGTRSFIAGRPIFGTLIALLGEGWPMIGVIDQPIGGERWLGAVTPIGGLAFLLGWAALVWAALRA